MAINVSIYSNGNNKTQTVSVDFAADFLAASLTGVSNELQYFFKFTTSAKDSGAKSFPVKVVQDLSDLALVNASNVAAERYQSATNTANAYTNIDTMVIDYLYDYINGHDADQWLSGCAEQLPIKFS